MRDEGNELEIAQNAIGASDEEVAARAGISTNTLRRAKRGETPDGTRNSILRAMEAIRVERIDRLTKLKVRTAG